MNDIQINEIVKVMPKGRTKFYYYDGRYALMLLKYVEHKYKTIGAVKQSGFCRLLDTPSVKERMAALGSGNIDGRISENWPKNTVEFLLTLDCWGKEEKGRRRRWSFHQTTRNQKNLVLQVNFSNRHNRDYGRLVDPLNERYFVNTNHPVRDEKYMTMAWSRLDLDLDTGEALIEEIQTDWLRDAYQDGYYYLDLPRWSRATIREKWRIVKFQTYLKSILQPYRKIWQEAVLAATIWFLKEEIGIRRIFYHTWSSGNFLKGLDDTWAPPVSLYTQLPRKFCFTQTQRIPGFLMRDCAHRIKEGIENKKINFFYLEL